ncbi:MAG: M55 family metallopeptidase [Thermomicrobium sp.]|nr:M55 family metallopeptidase [Thermomicrobium sp.]MDW8059439.1 M55 family metallopeptidase [Thermomicrobium sp.]
MELLIVSDLEGLSGVERWEACRPAHPLYPATVERYVAEVEAISRAAMRLGIGRTALLDWHGRTLSVDRLGPTVRPALLPFDRAARVAVLLGFHARTGQPESFAAHTYRPGLRILWDGREAGELALASRWLGERGVPLVLVTGDRGLTREAEEWTEQTATVAVKRALAPDRAESLPPARAHEAIATALERVLLRRSWWWVYRPEVPVAWEVRTPEGKRVDLVAPSVEAALERLRALVPSVSLPWSAQPEGSR